MKSALVGLDPTTTKGPSFERFAAVVRHFQQKGFFADTALAAVMHSDLYAMPTRWYHKMKPQLVREALAGIRALAKDRIQFSSAKILTSNSSANEDLVASLCRYGRNQDVDVVVVASNDRVGLPYWALGSFSETAALTATLPIMIIKPHVQPSDLARKPRLVVCVDAASPPSVKAMRWIRQAALGAAAHVDLVYVEPKARPVVDQLQQRRGKGEATTVLKQVQRTLRAAGVTSEVVLLKEAKSIAQTVVDYADRKKAWAIITSTPKRSMVRRLLLGSSSRRILMLTKRPFLSLRFD